MKNKRTKLTAILLSALMAVSTIASVANASELFTDGKGSEENVSADVIENEEIPTEAFEDDVLSEELMTAAPEGIGPDRITFSDTTNGVNSVFLDPNDGLYKIKVHIVHTKYNSSSNLEEDTSRPAVDEDVVVTAGTPEGENCLHPARIPCTLSNDSDINHKLNLDSPITVYYIIPRKDGTTWDSEKCHVESTNNEVILHPSFQKQNDGSYSDSYGQVQQSCTVDGKRWVYTTCSVCGKIKVGTAWKSWDEISFSSGKASTFENFTTSLENEFKSAYSTASASGSIGNLIKGTSTGIEFNLVISRATGHQKTDPKKQTTPPNSSDDYLSSAEIKDAIDLLYKKGLITDNEYNDLQSSNQKYYDYVANCTITSDGQAGELDPDKDAFYYNVYKCPVCGEEWGEKVIFYHANVKEGAKVYLVGSGVKGFLRKNSTGSTYEDYDSAMIPVEEFVDVLLDDCTKGGIYYLCTLNSEGTPATKSPITVEPGHHTWGPIQLDVNSAVTKQYLTFYQYANAADRTAKKPVMKDGNVVAANCMTEAYFEVKQTCRSCGASNKEVMGKKKALQGPHSMEIEYKDPYKIDYTPVDEKHHLEHYYDHVKCTLCGKEEVRDSATPDALVAHTFTSQPVPGSEKEATCGEDGYLQRRQTCVCTYADESTTTTVTIPKTDKHDFGDNKAYLEWSGDVYIANGSKSSHNIVVRVGRKCNVCENFDGNGINTQGINHEIGGLVIRPDTFTVTKTRDAQIDPATGIAYRCSTALATIEVNWVGTVDGEVVTLNKDNTDSAVRENVPYYSDEADFAARTAHTPGAPHKEGDQIVRRCTVCGDIVSVKDDDTPSVAVPTVSAASVDYDSVNVSWTKVEGATAYRLYYRSSDEGISKWTKIRTFTSDTTSYPVNGLTTGSKYRFTVRAEVTQDGKTTLGDYSRKGAVAVPKLTAPEIKSVTASGKTTKVTWSRVDGASGYIVFRNSQRVGTVTKGSKVTWTDKKSVSGAKYQIRAYRTEDKKNYKSELSVAK